jgi:hypothetical protein
MRFAYIPLAQEHQAKKASSVLNNSVVLWQDGSNGVSPLASGRIAIRDIAIILASNCQKTAFL